MVSQCSRKLEGPMDRSLKTEWAGKYLQICSCLAEMNPCINCGAVNFSWEMDRVCPFCINNTEYTSPDHDFTFPDYTF